MASLESLLLALGQWLQNPLVAQVFAVVFSTALLSFGAHKVLASMGRRAEASSNLWDDAFLRTISKPAQWLIWVVGISFAADLIAVHQSQSQLEIIAMARYLAMILLVALFVTRMAKEIEKAWHGIGTWRV